MGRLFTEDEVFNIIDDADHLDDAKANLRAKINEYDQENFPLEHLVGEKIAEEDIIMAKSVNNGEKMDSKKELYLKRYRKITGITADEATDEKLWQMCKDTAVMGGIKMDEAVKELGRVVQNQYPIIKKTLDGINKACKAFSQKHV